MIPVGARPADADKSVILARDDYGALVCPPLAVVDGDVQRVERCGEDLDDSRIAHTNGVDLDHVRKMLLKKRFVIRGKVPAPGPGGQHPQDEGADENRPP